MDLESAEEIALAKDKDFIKRFDEIRGKVVHPTVSYVAMENIGRGPENIAFLNTAQMPRLRKKSRA
jgi:hypothetical protein